MSKMLALASPHTHAGTSTTRLMYIVAACLLPAAAAGVLYFGLPALIVLASCIAAACLSEWLCLLLRRRDWRACMDGSALLTGLLLAMSLPASTPWWVAAFGSAFAIIIGKQVFGGLGHNPFNPAMLGRVMLLICFPVELTDWRAIATPDFADGEIILSAAWQGIDAISAATPLYNMAEGLSLVELVSGAHPGSLGETSSILILLGGLALVWLKIIRPVIPVALLLGLGAPALVAHLIAPESFDSILHHWLSGGTMLAAFFIATDLVSSPTSNKGQWVFGLGCGLLIWLIRSFGSYPEGVAFAVLIMNAATPVIDHYLRPAVFGSQSAHLQ
ncbi:RnfABCDGE type electron transport complex subunit D [Aliagarivorans taiwanensis]|uniref:RnfABCDGE type electron transport complex subunit D n=1 Tax=Aliagarivorans taiwanensis TaxID=561966 RepID=UPI000415D787|nr:RnfABCDGE type electron transport complex subunit D [Aliagarivorans taiwanensis]